MKKITIASIFLVAAAFAACGNYESSVASKPAPASNSNISFGLYDISSNGPSSAKVETRTTNSASTGSGSGSGTSSGGGGGGRLETTIAFQKISLDQTTASQVNTAPSDRKIIRNAELNLEAENPEQAQQQITAIAEMKGGFVVESQPTSPASSPK